MRFRRRAHHQERYGWLEANIFHIEPGTLHAHNYAGFPVRIVRLGRGAPPRVSFSESGGPLSSHRMSHVCAQHYQNNVAFKSRCAVVSYMSAIKFRKAFVSISIAGTFFINLCTSFRTMWKCANFSTFGHGQALDIASSVACRIILLVVHFICIRSQGCRWHLACTSCSVPRTMPLGNQVSKIAPPSAIVSDSEQQETTMEGLRKDVVEE